MMPWWVTHAVVATSAIDPAIVACLDDATLEAAIAGAPLADRVVLLAEMMARDESSIVRGL